MKSVERFTKTVQEYIKYRPSYPREVLQILIDDCGLTKTSIVADVGSGTGFLSKLILENGNTVYGVEPNQVMRNAAEEYLKSYSNFHSVDGTAEATTLKSNSIDIVTAGTAFHWFNTIEAKKEFKRILKLPAWVFLVWNVRNIKQSSFLRDYENLILKYGTDYRESNARKFDKTVLEGFFKPTEMKKQSFKNSQQFNWEGLKGRLLSSSYSLRPGDRGYEDMLQALRELFECYEKNGIIEFLYDTKIYYGRLFL